MFSTVPPSRTQMPTAREQSFTRQSPKVMLRMSPQVSVPIFSAESRECSTQFVMVTLQQGPYRRVIGRSP